MLGSEHPKPISPPLHYSITPTFQDEELPCATQPMTALGLSSSIPRELQLRNKGLRTADISPLMPFARQLANARENRDSHIGFVGYDKTKAGNKILIAIDREYDLDVPHAVAAALREKGAHVDLLVADMGDPDRVFDYTDEVDVIMRREPWDNKPRRWEGMPYIERFRAARRIRSA